MNLKDLKELLQILDEKAITEFELEEEGMKVRVRKGATSADHAAPGAGPAAYPGPTTVAPAPGGPPGAASPGAPPAAPAAPEGGEVGVVVVKSPIVGTFYRAPDPNSPPFVNVGDHVRVGQVLCVIEAMKLMNEIEAEVAGQIVKIHQDNGQPVQYGDPLFSVRA
ncbi:MAG: acetyl-CoA carboxylase biotin carboxyl carrier protein [Acidobacteria bacterium]|nr:acetyl-CoA carboxylase biotin carboxyl carrier protein [Acidobacteriota bacterium]